MPYKISWLVEKRVLYTEFEGVITSEELGNFITDMTSMMEEGTPLVHHISNSLQLERVTFSLAGARSMAGAFKLTKMLGWQIDINQNQLNRMFADILSQFARVRSRTVLTYDDAIAFLKENDETLNQLEWAHDTVQYKA